MKARFYSLLFFFIYISNSICAQAEDEDSLLIEATRLEQEADSCVQIGDINSALTFYSKSADIRKSIQGSNDLYAICLYKLASVYLKNGGYHDAIRIGSQAMDIFKLELGEEHVLYALSLTLLAACNSAIGNDIEAIRLESKALVIYRKELGEEDPSYTLSLTLLAQCNSSIGNYIEAIRLETEVVEIYRKNMGENHLNYAESLHSLALYNSFDKKYSESIRLEKEALMAFQRAFGEDSLKYINSLHNIAFFYSLEKNYPEAICYETKVLNCRRNNLGEDNPDYIATLKNLANYYSYNDNDAEAITLRKEVLNYYNNNFGIDHPDYADLLMDISINNSSLGNYSEAAKYGTEAKDIYKKIYGVEHPNYAKSLLNLSSSISILGNYSDAIKYVTEAKDIFKKIYGVEHPDYATALLGLAANYFTIRKYVEAVKFEKEATQIFKRIEGDNSFGYASSLSNLADYNYNLGNISEAIEQGTEVLGIYKKIYGKNHYLYAQSLGQLASYKSSLGKYAEAIMMEDEAISIIKNTLGEDHYRIGSLLHDKAIFECRLGNYNEAIKLETMALEIEGEDSPNYAISLENLSFVNYCLGNHNEAIYLATKAMDIFRKKFGRKSIYYAQMLGSLASDYSAIGNNKKAIKLVTEALKITKEILGEEHTEYSRFLQNLAVYYSRINNYVDALKFVTLSIEKDKRNIGTTHPNYASSLVNCADYNYHLGNNAQAIEAILHAADVNSNNLISSFSKLSSQRRKYYWNQLSPFFLKIFPMYVYKFPHPNMISTLFDKTALLSKGILLNTEIEVSKLIEESGDEELLKFYQKLLSNYEIFEKQSNLPVAERCIDTDSLKTEIQNQEDILILKSQEYGDYMHIFNLTWRDVQKTLNDEDIAIEFLDIPVGKDSIMYIALTIKKQYDNPRMIPLFELKQLNNIKRNEYYRTSHLAKLIWGPLKEEMESVKNIYFSPSGELYKIGIEYLPYNEDLPFCEKYNTYRLSSTRQLVTSMKQTYNKYAVLYGGINYDSLPYSSKSDSNLDIDTINIRNNYVRVDSIPIRGHMGYLEGTKKEADTLSVYLEQHKWNYAYYTGNNGTEKSFKLMNGKSPSLLHLATHGFYMTEVDAMKEREFVLHESEIRMMKEPSFREDKPMTRSGLLLSGCNHALNHEVIPNNEDDGILTAQEIASLDLRGLDLVVLSACETGLGDVTSGEGVFGLQRGFKKAGANTIVMSLWKVSDKATEKLMTSFYQFFLNGMTKYEAFSKAREELRKAGSPRQAKPDWASFVMLDGLN